MDYQYNEQQTESYFIVFYTNCHNGNRSGFYENGDNTFSEYQVGFCGYFPANEPRYSMIVSMNKLGLPASGGRQAGPLFHDIVEDDYTRHAFNSIVNGNTRLIHTNISDYETIRFLFDDCAHEHDGINARCCEKQQE